MVKYNLEPFNHCLHSAKSNHKIFFNDDIIYWLKGKIYYYPLPQELTH